MSKYILEPRQSSLTNVSKELMSKPPFQASLTNVSEECLQCSPGCGSYANDDVEDCYVGGMGRTQARVAPEIQVQ